MVRAPAMGKGRALRSSFGAITCRAVKCKNKLHWHVLFDILYHFKLICESATNFVILFLFTVLLIFTTIVHAMHTSRPSGGAIFSDEQIKVYITTLLEKRHTDIPGDFR